MARALIDQSGDPGAFKDWTYPRPLSTLIRVCSARWSAIAALSIALSHTLAVPLTGMAEMDSFEVAARLQQLPVLAQTRIVAVTGYGEEHHRARTRSLGLPNTW